MINYDGPKAIFAIKQHPKQALADILHLRKAVSEQNDERARLLGDIDSLEGAQLRQAARIAELETELANLRARLP